MRSTLMRAAAAVCLLVFLLVPAALAQSHTAAPADLGGLYGVAKPYLADLVSTLIVVAGGWITTLLHRKFNLDIEASHRDALQTALTNAAGAALNRLGNQLTGKTIDVRNQAVAEAVNLVIRSAPDALAHFGISPDMIAQKIVAKLPQVANTTTPAAPAAAAA